MKAQLTDTWKKVNRLRKISTKSLPDPDHTKKTLIYNVYFFLFLPSLIAFLIAYQIDSLTR